MSIFGTSHRILTSAAAAIWLVFSVRTFKSANLFGHIRARRAINTLRRRGDTIDLSPGAHCAALLKQIPVLTMGGAKVIDSGLDLSPSAGDIARAVLLDPITMSACERLADDKTLTDEEKAALRANIKRVSYTEVERQRALYGGSTPYSLDPDGNQDA